MANRTELLTGVGVGAGLVYLLDPQRGPRRRARLRDSAVRTMHVASAAADITVRDVMNRARGTVAEWRARTTSAEADDTILVERVRAKLGRVVSHPRAIAVTASCGVVTLAGAVIGAELPRLLRAVERVRGVRDVVNQLEEYKTAENIRAVQGGRVRRSIAADLFREPWAPAARLLVGMGGIACVTLGARRRDVAGTLFLTGGALLLVRAGVNLDARRLFSVAAGWHAMDVQKTLVIGAPLEEVYAFWTEYENFPQFMSRVLDVRQTVPAGHSHWIVTGPLRPLEFDAEVTQAIPNELFAWRTVEGSLVGHSGVVRFESLPGGRTRVQLRMTYDPPYGWFGHGVAKAFGVDPKSGLDADLVRMKTLIETGQPPRDAARASTNTTTEPGG